MPIGRWAALRFALPVRPRPVLRAVHPTAASYIHMSQPPSAPPPAEVTLAGAEGPSKSAQKKAAKLAEKQAKAAAKNALKAEKGPAPATGGAKKEKVKKEVKEEPAWVDPTVPGEKKDLSAPMESGYHPLHVESSWYAWWEKKGFFTPTPPSDEAPWDPAKTFVIPLPPPNVTGVLHIGHALTISIQDALMRFYRMKGYRTAYVPGYDHAGISTQTVVEKRLAKQEGKSRYDYGREAFVEKVFQWKDEYQRRIGLQMRRLGASFDFSREAFTMDPTRSEAVTENFCRLFEDGILYRENRLVNWCVYLNTTLSNLEVVQKTLPGRTLMNVPGYPPNERIEFGVIVSFVYRVVDSDESIIVATTRPETILGDTAVAVHPDDERYKHLHGKKLQHPFLADRQIPIVTDSIVVDMSFGTGAVKITPAHDPNDYEVGKRHGLPFINILNDDGTLNENAGEFAGMKRFSARRAVVEALKARGLYVETKDNPMVVPVCERSGDVIEPVMKPQWWVNCKPLAEAAVAKVQSEDMIIEPPQSKREFFRWMENIQDWCVSRQLWWGHRCPAYFVDIDGETQDPAESRWWVVGRTLAQADGRAAKLAAGRPYTLKQDEDVLDTWFSSGLWPFSTLGWPKASDDMRYYYPTSMLETGWDILFFWVARMIMLGVYHTGQLPFKEVFCHAMVRDAHGRKMSKSLGNVIDPIDVIEGISLEGLQQRLREGNLDEKEIAKAAAGQKKDYPKGIPQCGTDALRFTLCAYTAAGRDINLDILRVEGYRKFCNKLWNATRFALLKLQDGFQPLTLDAQDAFAPQSLVEKWILHRLNVTARQLNSDMESRSFMSATTCIYNFWLYDLCDVYIEAIKPITDPSAEPAARASAQHTLYACLDAGLKMLHPFMPFVTEELWHRLPSRPGETSETIAHARFPTWNDTHDFGAQAAQFEDVFASVRAIRGLAADYGLTSQIQAYIEAPDAAVRAMLSSQQSVMHTLIKGCESVACVAQASDVPAGCVVASVSASIQAHLLVRGLVDIDQELSKLAKKLALNETQLQRTTALTQKPDWAKTPEDVRATTEQRLHDLEGEKAALMQAQANFEHLRSA
ncbi:Mitochondrial and cytoplasmic valyl-tRNA synthetase [Malassezia sympodialis ATCC 42132]|uniref:Valine--tRNA ligase, mitochondrial n=2 Tax=Malassezia sympodialis (strain ATCC 42132) TaxID=1230383 RepID=A0A1M8A7H1_MALS4|nr:Mitochondrial and cytoplasmic valyl-tRNA synthetase [Malassezia sympodialis ATCC 42132]